MSRRETVGNRKIDGHVGVGSWRRPDGSRSTLVVDFQSMLKGCTQRLHTHGCSPAATKETVFWKGFHGGYICSPCEQFWVSGFGSCVDKRDCFLENISDLDAASRSAPAASFFAGLQTLDCKHTVPNENAKGCRCTSIKGSNSVTGFSTCQRLPSIRWIHLYPVSRKSVD